jgi:hypothetical protein
MDVSLLSRLLRVAGTNENAISAPHPAKAGQAAFLACMAWCVG